MEDILAVTIAPTSGARILQFRVSRGAVIALSVVLGIGLLVLVAAITFYGHLLNEANAARRLRTDNIQLQRQLERLGILETRLSELDRSRRALFEVVGVEDGAELETERPLVTDSEGEQLRAYVRAAPGGTLEEFALEELRRILHHLPLDGPQTRGFGLLGSTGVFHTGVDVAGDMHAPIDAAGEGIVSFIGFDDAFGMVVVIAHRPGVHTMYGHVSEILVQLGDYVTAGQPIARAGNTGHSTAPHLHFELHWRGKAIDPALVIATWEQESAAGRDAEGD